MKVIEFKIKMADAYTDLQLIKSGWKVEDKDKLYTRINGNYKFSYYIKSFGKIRISEIIGQFETKEKLQLEDWEEFNFEDAWNSLWKKSFVPQSVELLIKETIFAQLVANGWKPSVLGVIEYIVDEYNLSYYYPSLESEKLYKLVDDNPVDVLKFVSKLNALKINN
jgi:hypothetical protein